MLFEENWKEAHILFEMLEPIDNIEVVQDHGLNLVVREIASVGSLNLGCIKSVVYMAACVAICFLTSKYRGLQSIAKDSHVCVNYFFLKIVFL